MSYGCCVSLLLVSDLAVPLVEDVVQWRIDSNRHSTLTRSSRSLVNRLYDRMLRSYPLSMSTPCSLVEFILLSCMELRPIVTGSNTLVLLSFSFTVDLSLAIDCEATRRRRVDRINSI